MGNRSGLGSIMLAAVVVALVGLLIAASDPPTAHAACGTNWQSKKEPPESIRVLRTATGKVEEVGFKRYVAVVMASGEWPSSLPVALLEAGALATKQYGWYYALEGNHRDGYKNASGNCYDVRDDSKDQVYRPETAEPTDKQKAARDALWGLSLRKNDKFFLTGYRQGSATKCAQDHDEWKLYATSAKDCAKRLDYDSIEILHAYYSPKLTKVWAPGTEPEADEEDAAGEAAEDSDGSDTTDDDESAGEAAEDSDGSDTTDEDSTEDEASSADEAGSDDPTDDESTGPIGSLLDRVRSIFDRDEEA